MEGEAPEIKIKSLEDDIVVEDAGIEYTNEADLADIEASDDSVAAIIARLNSEDWKENFFGVDDLRRLYRHHPAEFGSYLPKFQSNIVEDVENLRSSIARNTLMLVNEIFSTDKNTNESSDSGATSAYTTFAVAVLPIVCKRLADDKSFISSRAKTATELIAKHCINKLITEELCNLTRSKSLVIASEANHALRSSTVLMSADHVKDKNNMDKLLKCISEDLVSKRQPFSKNSKLMLKEFKEKVGDDGLKEVAMEVLGNEDEVKKIMQAFLAKKGKDSSKGFREFLQKKKSVKSKKDETVEDTFA